MGPAGPVEVAVALGGINAEDVTTGMLDAVTGGEELVETIGE